MIRRRPLFFFFFSLGSFHRENCPSREDRYNRGYDEKPLLVESRHLSNLSPFFLRFQWRWNRGYPRHYLQARLPSETRNPHRLALAALPLAQRRFRLWRI